MYEQVPGPLTALVWSVRAGARFDGAVPGLAHMAEHMLFQGTERLDQLALNRRAAELGGNHNAETSYETVEILLEVLNEDVEDAIGLLAEQFYETRIDARRFAKERRIVLDEIRSYQEDPLDFLHERGWEAFFDAPIGRPICGTGASLRAMQPEDVVRFLRRYFVNANSVLCVVGGVAGETVRRAVRRHVRADRVGKPARGAGARGKARGRLVVRGGPRGQSFVARFLELDARIENLLAVGVALDLVGADADGALFQAVRERYGLGYEVSAGLEVGVGWAAAVLSASARPGQADRLAGVVDEVLAESIARPPTAEDLARARKKRRYGYVASAQRRLDRALVLADATFTGFPLPEEAERLVDGLGDEHLTSAWNRALQGRSLTALLPG